MTALVAGLVAILVFAMLRFAAAARDSRRHLRAGGMETALLSQALEDAITQLKAQERAMAARAEASERLSGQIVASLTAGLVVTDLDGGVQIVNPSSRRLLGLGDGAARRHRARDARGVLAADCGDRRVPARSAADRPPRPRAGRLAHRRHASWRHGVAAGE